MDTLVNDRSRTSTDVLPYERPEDSSDARRPTGVWHKTKGFEPSAWTRSSSTVREPQRTSCPTRGPKTPPTPDARRASGGGGGIRTHGSLSTTPVFKTGALNRSATPPRAWRRVESWWIAERGSRVPPDAVASWLPKATGGARFRSRKSYARRGLDLTEWAGKGAVVSVRRLGLSLGCVGHRCR
jgi:hypothetical protein